MPRYYIDTDDNDRFVLDDVGQDLADAEAARRVALASLPEMADEKLPDGDHRIFVVRVRDDQGNTLYTAELKLTGQWLVRPAT